MDVITEFFKQNTMMNERLLDACRQLSPEQLGVTVAGTYGSIGATLVHIANSQLSYAARILGTERAASLDEEPFPGFERLADQYAVGNSQLELAATKAASPNEVVVRGDDPVGEWRIPAALILLQAVNHATEHRSQVATILTQLGVEPPDMSGWAFFLDAGHMVET